MQAIVIERLDGPDAAVVRDVPEPGHHHHRAGGVRVVVEVRAVGLSVIDVLQSRGRYQYGTPTPYVLGSEIAGVVVEADPASGFAVGDRVGSIVFWGGMAERAVVALDYTAKLPDDMSFVQGAAVYLNYSTAWFALHRSGVRPGGTVLVHGAAGGVGTALLDLADAFGVRAIAVVSSDDKAELARRAGADEVIRSDGPWKDDVLRLTDGHGVDAVLDPVGGDRFTDSLRALRTGGMLVVIGFAGGSIPEVRVNRLLLRNLSVTGISMDTMDAEYPGTLRMVRDAVQDLMAAGRIHPVVGRVFPFVEAADAMRLIESRDALGKVVVTGP
ncbi:NADPH:quinone oxidoreductase family protein [Curtobacterium sp. MCBD17_013]|uniref:NADPH:quinone oxidoreductase family protein n=1 Tax=Curtobacterium sp. MCBD17_013 TaxID=2175668 RepID=UPI000DA8733F|nr:NADPH:quinone oxidoreductase family protein [Curtobacterium sp. MCBD17_013]PZF63267.1 NADPH:quinone oxidoreductase family protein [Curtobacterium sp. MCBD17_013]